MHLKEKLDHLPISPGCYMMKDKNNKVIYIGKAKNLKNRVKSYFTGAHNLKTTKLVSEIFDFELVLTNSEQESLILELNLIKQYRPKYNIIFMDDKSYPYIQISNSTPPTIKVVRTKNVTGKIFGPYPNTKSAYDTARLLELMFPMGRIEPIPNFYEAIGQSIEPNKKDNYSKQVEVITKFLKGDTKQIIDELNNTMIKASESLMFERAGIIRDQIEAIKTTTEKQIVSLNDFKDRDVIGIAYDDEDVAIQILFMRSGRIVDQHQVIFSYVGDPLGFSINYFCQYYEKHQPDEILLDPIFENKEIDKFIKNTFIPSKGDKRKMVVLANKNAKHDLERNKLLYKTQFQKTFETLDRLKSMLNIEKLDLIEVFDNSQLFGTAPISAMIVYENGKFNRKLYRKYHLKGNLVDDYSAMKEVIYRRYRKVLMEKLQLPDLVLVDGGKGQVSVANEVINSLGMNLLVVGLKKDNRHRLESLILNNDTEIIIKDDKEVFQLLSKISDEVHRYAIEFHRNTRNQQAYSSPLDEVKGLGKTRKTILFQSFDSLKAIYEASDEELLALKIPKRVIDNIRSVLKNEINN